MIKYCKVEDINNIIEAFCSDKCPSCGELHQTINPHKFSFCQQIYVELFNVIYKLHESTNFLSDFNSIYELKTYVINEIFFEICQNNIMEGIEPRFEWAAQKVSSLLLEHNLTEDIVNEIQLQAENWISEIIKIIAFRTEFKFSDNFWKLSENDKLTQQDFGSDPIENQNNESDWEDDLTDSDMPGLISEGEIISDN